MAVAEIPLKFIQNNGTITPAGSPAEIPIWTFPANFTCGTLVYSAIAPTLGSAIWNITVANTNPLTQAVVLQGTAVGTPPSVPIVVLIGGLVTVEVAQHATLSQNYSFGGYFY